MDAQEKWNAVLQRDSGADSFVYAVRTTGIYCRPGCASRTPKRLNVLFFDSCAEAEQSGYRSCLRCHPHQPSVPSLSMQALDKARTMIEAGDGAPRLDDLAQACALSKFHLQRLFRARFGVTPLQYSRQLRVDAAKAKLVASSSVTEVVYESGFNSSSSFYKTVPAMVGMTPSAYRFKGKGEDITWTTGTCSLGTVLVARTERGICAVRLGESAAELVEELRREFAAAKFHDSDAETGRLLAEVIRCVEHPSGESTLPLDASGTAFQHRVWEALRGTVAGTPLTYAELARRMGIPKSTRAVARACASNPIAVLVPCHRAIGSDGALRGYRWGLHRKRELLKREASANGDVD